MKVVVGLITVATVFATLCFAIDEIKDLPGINFKLNFKHYSGFLNASDTHFLHYWFVESQGNPAKDPLIFWFNGGPGCSSLDGLLNEMGPYEVSEDGKTMKQNEQSWNKFASVVYIESPAGVGFSYSTDGNTEANDKQTAAENYEAIKQFFAKHPGFRNHSVFIMGESYGGVYVPSLTLNIVEGEKNYPINIRGMALGNGYVHEKINIDTSVRFAYAHGLIDEKVWQTVERDCCHGCVESCDLTSVQGHCASLVTDIFNFIWFGGLNPYDLYRDCDPNPSVNSNRMTSNRIGILPRSFIVHQSKSSNFRRKQFPRFGASVPCLNDTDLLTYMNDPEVRIALNIPSNLGTWDICSDKITESYKKQYTDMTPFVQKIVKANVRVLLYYGDTDMACNFMMGQQFASQLGFPRVLGKTPWKYNKQIAGFKTLYKGVTYITIRGAGHMAPQWRAPETTYAIKQFVLNHPI